MTTPLRLLILVFLYKMPSDCGRKSREDDAFGLKNQSYFSGIISLKTRNLSANKLQHHSANPDSILFISISGHYGYNKMDPTRNTYTLLLWIPSQSVFRLRHQSPSMACLGHTGIPKIDHPRPYFSISQQHIQLFYNGLLLGVRIERCRTRRKICRYLSSKKKFQWISIHHKQCGVPSDKAKIGPPSSAKTKDAFNWQEYDAE